MKRIKSSEKKGLSVRRKGKSDRKIRESGGGGGGAGVREGTSVPTQCSRSAKWYKSSKQVPTLRTFMPIF